MDIHQRAILVSLRVSSWAARKYDKKVSDEAAQANNASSDAGRYNKNLLPGSVLEVPSAKHKKAAAQVASTVTKTSSYKRLMQHIAAMRVWHYQQTLAWSDDGWRMLPIRNYQVYTDGIRKRFHELDSLLAEFITDYPALRELARKLLNGMYSDSDYPAHIGERFSHSVEYSPVPSGADFRVTLADSEIAAIMANTETRVKNAAADAQADAVKRLYSCLSRIQERLSTTKVSGRKADAGEKIGVTFRDTLISNARDLCDVLTRLNIADDAKLETFRRETELLAATEPDTLRDCADVRIETANRAQSILDAMTQTYGKSMFGGK